MTVILLILSWSVNVVRIGALVLCIHDPVDYLLTVSHIQTSLIKTSPHYTFEFVFLFQIYKRKWIVGAGFNQTIVSYKRFWGDNIYEFSGYFKGIFTVIR